MRSSFHIFAKWLIIIQEIPTFCDLYLLVCVSLQLRIGACTRKKWQMLRVDGALVQVFATKMKRSVLLKKKTLLSSQQVSHTSKSLLSGRIKYFWTSFSVVSLDASRFLTSVEVLIFESETCHSYKWTFFLKLLTRTQGRRKVWLLANVSWWYDDDDDIDVDDDDACSCCWCS